MDTHNVRATSLSKRPVSAVSNAILDAGSEEDEGSEYEIEEGNESGEEDHHPKSRKKLTAKSVPTNTGVTQNSLPTNICIARRTLNKLDVPGNKIEDTIVRYNIFCSFCNSLIQFFFLN